MYLSETSFTHLRAADEARLARELERRRVVAERLAEQEQEQAQGHPGPRWRARRRGGSAEQLLHPIRTRHA